MKNPSTSNKSQTDWERLEAMTDDDIDTSDIPPVTPEMFAQAVVKRGLKTRDNKAQLTIRVDRDVLNWFKSRGRGYQTQINALLRAFMEASKSARR
ncbi:MAG: BrnA antitoxin family protein [Anaerolineales bacterium]|nr:MAG: BrnA antitoxin family protein [Anaerolineales bacterium]